MSLPRFSDSQQALGFESELRSALKAQRKLLRPADRSWLRAATPARNYDGTTKTPGEENSKLGSRVDVLSVLRSLSPETLCRLEGARKRIPTDLLTAPLAKPTESSPTSKHRLSSLAPKFIPVEPFKRARKAIPEVLGRTMVLTQNLPRSADRRSSQICTIINILINQHMPSNHCSLR